MRKLVFTSGCIGAVALMCLSPIGVGASTRDGLTSNHKPRTASTAPQVVSKVSTASNKIAYHTDDVTSIQKMIQENGLQADSQDPSKWDFVTWSEGENKRVIQLDLTERNLVGELDLTKLSGLKGIDCSNNKLTKVNASNLKALEKLYCNENQILELNLSQTTLLKRLNCGSNKLQSITLSDVDALITLDCGFNELSTLNLSNLKELTYLDCGNNNLDTIDTTYNTKLKYYINRDNELTTLDLKKQTNSAFVDSVNNPLTSVDFTETDKIRILPDEKGSATISSVDKATKKVTLVAVANESHHFENWTINGEVGSVQSTYTLTVEGDINVKPNFKEDSVATVTDVSISTMPRKTTYVEGDNFLPWGLTVKVTFSDGKELLVPYSNVNQYQFTFMPNLQYKLKAQDTQVRVICRGFENIIPITVQPITKSGWVKDENGYQYYNQNGTKLKGTWLEEDGVWYFFNEEGYNQKGWFQSAGRWYYADGKDKAAMKTGWQKLDNKWYYLGSGDQGHMRTGWQKLDNKWYYLGSGDQGHMRTGWQKLDNKWYYLGSGDQGHMRSGWLKLGVDWYYLGSQNDGVMKTGWVTISNKQYKFAENGIWTGQEK